jgi:hypothetical protein
MPDQSVIVASGFPATRTFENAAATPTKNKSWDVVQTDQIFEVSYGGNFDFPQYAALHTESAFLRLNYGKLSGWGTSIVLLPSFWSAGRYYQGAPIKTSWRTEDSDLVFAFTGLIGGLLVDGQILLEPPAANLISGTVILFFQGGIDLDRRAGEAFKPVVLSSMHTSANYWDARFAQVGPYMFRIPVDGWITSSDIRSRFFALKGGSSLWKTNAPTVEIVLKDELQIAGWKAQSSNPNDDNVGLWAASDEVLTFCQYSFVVKP